MENTDTSNDKIILRNLLKHSNKQFQGQTGRLEDLTSFYVDKLEQEHIEPLIRMCPKLRQIRLNNASLKDNKLFQLDHVDKISFRSEKQLLAQISEQEQTNIKNRIKDITLYTGEANEENNLRMSEILKSTLVDKPALETINFISDWGGLCNENLLYLKYFPKLIHLTFERICFQNNGFDIVVSNSPNLQGLVLKECIIDSKDYELIKNLKKLKSITVIQQYRWRQYLIQMFKNLPASLESITLQSFIQPEAIELLFEKSPRIKHIDFENCESSQNSISLLIEKAQKGQVEGIKLTPYQLLTRKDLDILFKLQLKCLVIEWEIQDMTNLDLKAISQMTNLEELAIGGSQLLDRGLIYLARLKNLKSLILSYLGVENKSVLKLQICLKKIPKIQIKNVQQIIDRRFSQNRLHMKDKY